MRVSERNTVPVSGSSLGGAGLGGWAGCCPRSAKAARTTIGKMQGRVRLLTRRIVPRSPDGPEMRQSFRLNQFHLHAPVLAVAILIQRRIAENILVAQLDSDFGGDVRQFVQILHGVL